MEKPSLILGTSEVNSMGSTVLPRASKAATDSVELSPNAPGHKYTCKAGKELLVWDGKWFQG